MHWEDLNALIERYLFFLYNKRKQYYIQLAVFVVLCAPQQRTLKSNNQELIEMRTFSFNSRGLIEALHLLF